MYRKREVNIKEYEENYDDGDYGRVLRRERKE